MKSPCEKCGAAYLCGGCNKWRRWFKKHWREIRKQAGMKVEEDDNGDFEESGDSVPAGL